MDFTTYYCGPYWSEGKFQPSVVGSKPGVNELDEACREHDTLYALHKGNLEMLSAADNKFYHRTSDLGLRGRLYGSAVYYGNKLARGQMFALPFAGLLGYGAASTALLGTRLRTVRVQPSGETEIPVGVGETTYDPYVHGSGPGNQRIDDAMHGASAAQAVQPMPNNESHRLPVRGHYVGTLASQQKLYRPLRKKKIRPLILSKVSPKNKNTKNPPKIEKLAVSHATHVDQASCKHEEIRSCFNYQYCPRCNREFHQGRRTRR